MKRKRQYISEILTKNDIMCVVMAMERSELQAKYEKLNIKTQDIGRSL